MEGIRMMLEINVWGDWYEAYCTYSTGFRGSEHEPPEPAEIRINALMHKATGTDVTFLLDSGVCDVFYDTAYAQLDAHLYEEAACAAEAKFDQRREEELMCRSC